MASVKLTWHDLSGSLSVGFAIILTMSTVGSAILARSDKEQVRVLLDSLPNDCTIEDVQYGLFVIERIRDGLEAVERGDVISHEEVKKRMEKWLTK